MSRYKHCASPKDLSAKTVCVCVCVCPRTSDCKMDFAVAIFTEEFSLSRSFNRIVLRHVCSRYVRTRTLRAILFSRKITQRCSISRAGDSLLSLWRETSRPSWSPRKTRYQGKPKPIKTPRANGGEARNYRESISLNHLRRNFGDAHRRYVKIRRPFRRARNSRPDSPGCRETVCFSVRNWNRSRWIRWLFNV